MYRKWSLLCNAVKCIQSLTKLNVIRVRLLPTELRSPRKATVNSITRYASTRRYSDNREKQKVFEENKSRLILCGLISTLLSIVGLDEEKEEIPELIMTIKRSILLIQKGEFNKAEQTLHIALKQAQDLRHYNAITYVYDVMANLAFETGQYKKAEKLFKSVLQRIISQGTPEDDPKVIHISLKVARVLERLGDTEKAEDGYNFCLKHLQARAFDRTENEDASVLRAMTLDWYAQMLASQDRDAEAFKYFLEAYDICIRIYGMEHELTATLLNNLGTVSYMKGEPDKALDYLSMAVEIGKKLKDVEQLGAAYVNLGTVYALMGLPEKAKELCKEGLTLSRIANNAQSLKAANECLDKLKKQTS